MSTYKIEITETLQKIIEIEAQSKDEAFQKVKEMYNREEIVLDSSDHVDTEMNIFKNE